MEISKGTDSKGELLRDLDGCEGRGWGVVAVVVHREKLQGRWRRERERKGHILGLMLEEEERKGKEGGRWVVKERMNRQRGGK